MKAGNTKKRTLCKLFISMLYISAFTFGGGFVIITLMKKKFVDELHWLDEQEMLDITALAQSSPGAIAVNAAILEGWRMAGWIGIAVSVVATILPPLIILSVISFFYDAFATNAYIALVLKGMQAGVGAVIMDVVVGLGGNVIKSRSAIHILIMCAGFVATFFFGVNVIYIIIAAALTGVLRGFYLKISEEKRT